MGKTFLEKKIFPKPFSKNFKPDKRRGFASARSHGYYIMAKKRSRRVYLGTTRRQKNTLVRNVCIAVVLIAAVVVASAFFLSWMLNQEEAMPALQPNGGMAGIGTQAVEKEPNETSPTQTSSKVSGEQEVSSNPDKSEKEEIALTGTPYKVLTYTDTWAVMLDAGHGFDDIGTTSALLGDTNEAVINLDITARVQRILEENHMTVYMTHDTNAVDGRQSTSLGGEMPKTGLVLLQPQDRAALANGHDIDLYVSIHCDSIPHQPDISGMRMYYCNAEALSQKRNSGAEALSASIANEFYAAFDQNTVLPRIRQLEEAEAYYVIREITVPSVLCEVGFVTNKEDAQNMLDEAWRERAAEGIANGILSYIKAAST